MAARGDGEPAALGKSYAHLEEAQIDSRLLCELRDHPLLLIPQRERLRMLEEFVAKRPLPSGRELLLSDYITKGDLCHKCKLVCEALLTSYERDYLKVLQHVQVERFFISRRFRVATTRVEPQLAVDAKTRQVTAGGSLGALPSALQSISLFELDGELMQGNRGLIDYLEPVRRTTRLVVAGGFGVEAGACRGRNLAYGLGWREKAVRATVAGSVLAALSGLGQHGLEVLAHHLVQDGPAGLPRSVLWRKRRAGRADVLLEGEGAGRHEEVVGRAVSPGAVLSAGVRVPDAAMRGSLGLRRAWQQRPSRPSPSALLRCSPARPSRSSRTPARPGRAPARPRCPG